MSRSTVIIVLHSFHVQELIVHFYNLWLRVVDKLIQSFNIEKCDLVRSVIGKGFTCQHVLKNKTAGVHKSEKVQGLAWQRHVHPKDSGVSKALIQPATCYEAS